MEKKSGSTKAGLLGNINKRNNSQSDKSQARPWGQTKKSPRRLEVRTGQEGPWRLGTGQKQSKKKPEVDHEKKIEKKGKQRSSVHHEIDWGLANK